MTLQQSAGASVREWVVGARVPEHCRDTILLADEHLRDASYHGKWKPKHVGAFRERRLRFLDVTESLDAVTRHTAPADSQDTLAEWSAMYRSFATEVLEMLDLCCISTWQLSILAWLPRWRSEHVRLARDFSAASADGSLAAVEEAVESMLGDPRLTSKSERELEMLTTAQGDRSKQSDPPAMDLPNYEELRANPRGRV